MPLETDQIARLRNVMTRSISPENFDGAKGGGGRATHGTGAVAARDLGVGWKISPSVIIASGTTFPMATIDGSSMITVNPHGGFNSFWPMPFQSHAELTIENLGGTDAVLYYQVSYETGSDGAGLGYLHAQFRRDNPLPAGSTHVLLDGVAGHGHYVGTYLAWGVNSPGWWGEGELRVYLDGDDDYPTICGTGTEDYFGGAWNFDVPGRGYTKYPTPYLGMPQVIRPDGLYQSQQRFGLYRWHVPDPIHFANDLRVEIQALGWQSGGRYLPLHDDIASTALFYLDRPHTRRPEFPHVDALQTGG